jgi:hypothetical protein
MRREFVIRKVINKKSNHQSKEYNVIWTKQLNKRGVTQVKSNLFYTIVIVLIIEQKRFV